ncbi:tetratricopeptide repeat protein, partial [Reichenbachiella sp.]
YLGDFDMSLNWFELANLTIPDDENGQVLKGICYNQMAKIYIEKHNFQQALNMYNNAIEITPDRSDYYLGRAWTHFKLGNRMSSLEDCVEAISIGAETMEEQAESYALMALIKFEDGEFGEAEYWVSKSLEVNSSEPYSVHLFSALYPGISSEGVNSGSFGQMLAGISIGLIFWEAATVYRLLMAGRFLGAASEIAGSVVVGAGLDELADVEESNKSLTLRNSRRSQRRSLSDLSNASVIINSSTQSIEQRVNQFQSKYAGARNYQGITKYHNKYYVLAGGHEVKNLNYYQKYHIDKNPRDAWEQFLNHHNYVYDQVFLERIDYVGDKWQFISSAHSSHDHGCQIIIDDKFPKDKILKAWSDKMKIMDIDHGEGSWVVTLRNDCVSHSWFPYIKQQFVQITYEFPEELIKTYWKRGYFISKLKFVGDKWLLLMEEYKWNTNVKEQRVLVENFFPTDRAYEHEQIGYDLQSISHGRGLWAVVVTKKE